MGFINLNTKLATLNKRWKLQTTPHQQLTAPEQSAIPNKRWRAVHTLTTFFYMCSDASWLETFGRLKIWLFASSAKTVVISSSNKIFHVVLTCFSFQLYDDTLQITSSRCLKNVSMSLIIYEEMNMKNCGCVMGVLSIHLMMICIAMKSTESYWHNFYKTKKVILGFPKHQ
jgi:hypothetical protein